VLWTGRDTSLMIAFPSKPLDSPDVHARIAVGICPAVVGWTVRNARSNGQPGREHLCGHAYTDPPSQYVAPRYDIGWSDTPTTVIPEDYGAILTLLLRYPSGSIDLPLDPSLILRQAMKILESPTAATGAAIALENHEVLGIQPFVQEEAETPSSSTSSTFRGKRQPTGFQRGKVGGTSSPAKAYGFESFTRGLMDRAQASGE
jgi:hypothetical protein